MWPAGRDGHVQLVEFQFPDGPESTVQRVPGKAPGRACDVHGSLRCNVAGQRIFSFSRAANYSLITLRVKTKAAGSNKAVGEVIPQSDQTGANCSLERASGKRPNQGKPPGDAGIGCLTLLRRGSLRKIEDLDPRRHPNL